MMAASYLPVGLAGVLLTASRSGFLAAIVALAGCGLLLLRRHTRILLAGAASLSTVATAAWFVLPHGTIERIATIPQQLQHGDLNQRLNIWAAGWQAFTHAPFFGWGAGTFVQTARLSSIDTAHNSALTIGVEGGVVALILAAAILIVCMRLVLVSRGSLRIALGTVFLVCLVASLVATVEGNRTTWVLLGMLSVAGRLTKEEPELMERYFSQAAPEASHLLTRGTP
jgi:O-antigen ligase